MQSDANGGQIIVTVSFVILNYIESDRFKLYVVVVIIIIVECRRIKERRNIDIT